MGKLSSIPMKRSVYQSALIENWIYVTGLGYIIPNLHINEDQTLGPVPFAIKITDLSVVFTNKTGIVPVLQEVTLSVPKGQIFGIIGRSGAGKSTLLRCLNGLTTPRTGDILIQNQHLTKTSPQDRRQILHKIGTVFQHFNLLSRRTVLQNIALPLEFMGASADEITLKTRKMADLVGLKDKHDAYPSTLSVGQKQRVAIARALVGDATLLLCDEFTSALDPETALEILALLQDLNQRLSTTIVLITHDMSVVREICDDVCVLEAGRVAEVGPVEAILLQPQHEVTQSLVSHLFVKDLPRTINDTLHAEPQPGDHGVIRLFFSNDTSYQPAIADIIQKFHVPMSIIMGSMGHVREVAFGSMVVTLPAHDSSVIPNILAYFQSHNISAQILGFIPPP